MIIFKIIQVIFLATTNRKLVRNKNVVCISRWDTKQTYVVASLAFALPSRPLRSLRMARSVLGVLAFLLSFYHQIPVQLAVGLTGNASFRLRPPNDTLCAHLIRPAGYHCSEHTVLSLSLSSICILIEQQSEVLCFSQFVF